MMGKYEEHYSSKTKKLIRNVDEIKKETEKNIEGVNKFVRDVNTEMFIDRYNSKYKRSIKKYLPKEDKDHSN